MAYELRFWADDMELVFRRKSSHGECCVDVLTALQLSIESWGWMSGVEWLAEPPPVQLATESDFRRCGDRVTPARPGTQKGRI